MAKFLKCTSKDGTELLINFDYVFRIKHLSEEAADGRQLTELDLMDPKSPRVIQVIDPLLSFESQLVATP